MRPRTRGTPPRGARAASCRGATNVRNLDAASSSHDGRDLGPAPRSGGSAAAAAVPRAARAVAHGGAHVRGREAPEFCAEARHERRGGADGARLAAARARGRRGGRASAGGARARRRSAGGRRRRRARRRRRRPAARARRGENGAGGGGDARRRARRREGPRRRAGARVRRAVPALRLHLLRVAHRAQRARGGARRPGDVPDRDEDGPPRADDGDVCRRRRADLRRDQLPQGVPGVDAQARAARHPGGDQGARHRRPPARSTRLPTRRAAPPPPPPSRRRPLRSSPASTSRTTRATSSTSSTRRRGRT